jgi:spore germination protein
MGPIRCRRTLGECSQGMRVAIVLAALALCALTAWPIEQDQIADGSAAPAFGEIWAYLLRGEEGELTGAEPITDLCFFGVNLARDGRIRETIARPTVRLQDGSQPAIHLVIAELSNQALMHFAMDPRYGVTPLLIGDICRVSEAFDGVQLDFEAVSRDDAEVFLAFLKELKARLPAGKKLSIAVPARTKLIADAYDYTRIAPLVDRLIVMAYDEHWSTSAPGPVASLAWCSRIAEYAKSAVAIDKLVMGLPLYGRAWQDKRLAKALRFENVEDLLAEEAIAAGYTPELGAHFDYSEDVVVTVFYDDLRSIMDKLWLYRSRGIGSVSFWRVGQGPPQLWSSIGRDGTGTTPAAIDGAESSPGTPQAPSR